VWAACARTGPRGTGVAAGGAPGSADTSEDVPLIGLQRGGRWSVLTVKPPHLSGPQFHLILKNSVLAGSISGGIAPAGSLRVNINEEGAEGFGPLGPVSLDFYSDEDSTVAEGTWNGGRVHLVFSRESLRGTVTSNSYFFGKNNPSTAGGMETFKNRSNRFPSHVTADMVDPLPADTSCEYYLTELGSDGSLSGGSTCAGMPQQTRLEVPRIAQAWLTRAELLTVLVAVLSAPPAVLAEEYGPKFEPPPTATPRRR
jgi:hypothetical protein